MPEHQLSKKLSNVGLSLEDYLMLIKEQKGKCSICGEEAKELVLDHCHLCKEIKNSFRGLLCRLCNMHNNLSLDEPNGLLLKAREYSLKHWNKYHQ